MTSSSPVIGSVDDVGSDVTVIDVPTVGSGAVVLFVPGDVIGPSSAVAWAVALALVPVSSPVVPPPSPPTTEGPHAAIATPSAMTIAIGASTVTRAAPQ